MRTGAQLLALMAMMAASAPASPSSLGKSLPDGSSVALSNVRVTAVFPSQDRIYVQEVSRACGVQVRSPMAFAEGATVSLSGIMRTDTATGERYVQHTPPAPDLGANASLHGNRPFPSDNPWNQRIDGEPVDPNSATLIASIGLTTGLHADFGANWNGGPFGIPYVIVQGTQPKVPVSFDYDDESDTGPYPIPPTAPIEGGPDSDGDRHVLVTDRDNWKLYETFYSWPQANGSWHAGSGAIFDMNTNALRPAGWTSADAAGLPIFPGLVRYDEVVEQKAIRHALRFTARYTRRAYVYPARHFASTDTSASRPPMGMRVRLKAGFDVSGFSPNVQVILRALKQYGMMLADNGSNWYVSGAPDPRWNDDDMSTLRNVKGSDFEVVKMGTVVTQ